MRAALGREPQLLGRVTRLLLDLHFPPSLHAELREAVGLDLEPAETEQLSTARRQRDRRMRELVLTAYEYRCALCGYDGRPGTVPVGLEAAHAHWWAFGGPDDIENGLCLCSLHHRLFDKGALGAGDGHRILVSQPFVGHSPAARKHVTALAGRPLVGSTAWRTPCGVRPPRLARPSGVPRRAAPRCDCLNPSAGPPESSRSRPGYATQVPWQQRPALIDAQNAFSTHEAGKPRKHVRTTDGCFPRPGTL